MYVNIHACIISLHMDTNQVYNTNQLTISHSSEVPQTKKPTPLQFNRFAPEKWWLEDDPFLLGPGNFSGAFAVKLLKGKPSNFSFPYLLMVQKFSNNHLVTWFWVPPVFQLPTCNLNWWTTPDFRDPSAQYLLRCRYGGLSLWHHRGHHGFRGQAGWISRCKRWDFCDVSLEGEKPYHEWYGGYGWIGQFHTKLFSKMLFVVFLCQRKVVFYTDCFEDFLCGIVGISLFFFVEGSGTMVLERVLEVVFVEEFCQRSLSKEFRLVMSWGLVKL